MGDAPAATEHWTETLADWLRQARCIAFLTGAGMSTESGIPDFRSAGGLYATAANRNVFDIAAFRADPTGFFAFARNFFPQVERAVPNAGHRAVAALGQRCGKTVHVATQNIDALHQRAGSPHVHPVHGTLDTVSCTRCGNRQPTAAVWPAIAAGGIPRHSQCGGVFKPDIVFFGECLPESVVAAAMDAMAAADLVIVAGTSLSVYPAADLPFQRRPGVPLAIVNRTPTSRDAEADLVIHAAIGTVLQQAVARLEGAPS